jgi:DNA repair protein RecN (Recombination protein N)
LDAFGKLDGLRQTVEELYRDWHAKVMKREALVMDEQERARRLDLLAFQKQELESAGLKAGEDEEMQKERERLRHADTLRLQAEEAYERLSGDAATGGSGTWGAGGAVPGGAVTSSEQAARALTDMARHDSTLGSWAERCRQSAVELRDVAEEVRQYRDRIEADPRRLEEIEQRLALIERLKRKYGATIEEMLKFLDHVTADWREIAHYQQAQDDLVAEIQKAEEAYGREAGELSHRRKAAGLKFLRAVEAELQALGMAHAALEIQWLPSDRPTAAGGEQAEFLVAPNPGESPKPLAKIASGGELSRLMLAFKVVLAKEDRVPTLIFDEIDAGVGGRMAEVIGRKLNAISRERQVVCVTHMAQVASFADAHYHITKEVEDHHTVTRAVKLASRRAVAEELAKMIGGESLTPVALKHAEELLEKARRSA